jgi:hypothetical protein
MRGFVLGQLPYCLQGMHVRRIQLYLCYKWSYKMHQLFFLAVHLAGEYKSFTRTMCCSNHR